MTGFGGFGFGATATEMEIVRAGAECCTGRNPLDVSPVFAALTALTGFAAGTGAAFAGSALFAGAAFAGSALFAGSAGAGGGSIVTFWPSAAAFAIARCFSSFARCSAKNFALSSAARLRFFARTDSWSPLPALDSAARSVAASPSSMELMAFVASSPAASAALRTSTLVTPASLASS